MNISLKLCNTQSSKIFCSCNRYIKLDISIVNLFFQNISRSLCNKYVHILLKIRKGHPVGCVVVLTKTQMYDFFLKLLTQVFPNLKDFKGIKISKRLKNKSFSLTLTDLINFKELEKQFYLFTNLPPLNVILITNARNKEELVYLLHSFKVPLS